MLRINARENCIFYALYISVLNEQELCENWMNAGQTNSRNVHYQSHIFYFSLREKCPITEFFLVHMFLYSDRIRRFTVSFLIKLQVSGLQLYWKRDRKSPYLVRIQEKMDFLMVFEIPIRLTIKRKWRDFKRRNKLVFLTKVELVATSKENW